MPTYYKAILCALFTTIFFNLGRANDTKPIPFNGATTLVIAPDMAGKVTFRVDMRNQTVAPDGVFFAANFFFTIGFSNWTFLPMCDLGQGIWAISFVDVPPGLYQYKYVNGIFPSVGWEFQASGGPCTDPANNNNRFVTITGGVQTEGPFCFESCDMVCTGNVAVTPNDITPPTIDMPVPNDLTLECDDIIPPLAALDASDACDANATTTTGLPIQTSVLVGCAGRILTRRWTVTDCAGNTTTAQQKITIADTTPPVFSAPLPANITVSCGSVPAALPIPATDACDPLVTMSAVPIDNTAGLNACGIGQIIRSWTVIDCAGNTATATQSITIVDNTPPVITQAAPPNITISCEDLFPYTQPLTASDNCTTTITVTNIPTDNIQGFSICGTGQVIRTWKVTDCAGNSATVSQIITVTDFKPPVFVGTLPTTISLSCEAALPPFQPLSVTENCTGSIVNSNLPTDNTTGLNTCGTGQIIRTWTAVDCSGNSASYTQIINIIDNTPPTITGTFPPDTTLNCGVPIPVGLPLSAMDNCLSAPILTSPPQDNTSGLSACGTGQIIRSWSVTDCAGNTSVRSQIITIVDNLAPVFTNIPSNISLCSGSPVPPMAILNWTDNCSNATGTTIGIETTNGNNITRTWTQTDACGNTATATQTIQFINAASANIGNDKTICGGQNITLNPNFTSNLTSFQWSSNGNGTFSNSTIANPTYTPGSIDLANGSTQLIFSATGSGGTCSQAADTILFTYATIPTANAGAAQTLTCLNTTVTLQGSSSILGGNFLWTGPGINPINQTLPNPTVNQPGSYTLVVTIPTTGCSSSAVMATVADNRILPNFTLTTSGQLNCVTTQVTLTGTNSSTNNIGPFTYRWFRNGQLIAGASDSIITASAAGTYRLEITNTSNGCSSTPQIVLLPPPVSPSDPPIVIIVDFPTNILTCKTPVITLGSIIIFTGTTPYTIQWTTLDGALSPGGGTVNKPDTYIMTVTDLISGCIGRDTVVILEDKTPPILTLNQNLVLGCLNNSVPLSSTVSGTAPFTYQWSGPNFQSTLPEPSATSIGLYRVTVTQANGCEAKATLQVTQSDSTISVDLSTQPACVDGMNGALIVENTTGTNPPFQYSVDGGAWQDSTRFDGLKAGNYTLTIQDKEGCSFDTSFTIPQAKAFTVDLPDQIVINLGDSVQLLPVLSDPGSAYIWSNPTSLICSDCFSPFAQPFENTNYTITVTNNNGCTATASVQVMVRVESNEYAPNVFDPSSDQPNNRFIIYTGKHVRNIKSLEIFDRWGELVFRSNNYPPNDPAGGWDGTTRSKKCASGIYVFVARLELINGTEKLLSGDVLLVR